VFDILVHNANYVFQIYNVVVIYMNEIKGRVIYVCIYLFIYLCNMLRVISILSVALDLQCFILSDNVACKITGNDVMKRVD
jgi:hypothetical protein